MQKLANHIITDDLTRLTAEAAVCRGIEVVKPSSECNNNITAETAVLQHKLELIDIFAELQDQTACQIGSCVTLHLLCATHWIFNSSIAEGMVPQSGRRRMLHQYRIPKIKMPKSVETRARYKLRRLKSDLVLY